MYGKQLSDLDKNFITSSDLLVYDCMLNVYLYTKKYLYLIQKITIMVEPLLSGIVLGLITVSAFGLFVAAFLQYRRGSQFEI